MRVFLLLIAALAAGLALACAAPSIAHAQSQEDCGGVEQPPCPKKKPPEPKPPEIEELEFVLTVGITGNGSVAGAGISCPDDCMETYPEHTVVVLVPLPPAGSQFIGWNGDCSGRGLCVVVMDGNHAVGATFAPLGGAPDPIGPQIDEVDDNGQAGRNTDVDLSFECLACNDVYIEELFALLLEHPVDEETLERLFPRVGTLGRAGFALELLQGVEHRANLVQELYRAFLRRAPASAELAQWLAALAGGASIEEVAAGILGSAEYFNTRGGGTNAGFIEALYQDILGRQPSEAEQAAWDAAFTAGRSRDEIALAVLQSAEARTRLIQNLFQSYLGRAPTEVELNVFLARLAGGATDEQIQADILGSDEFLERIDNYTATVDWGDGTITEVTVVHTGDGRVCLVRAVHVFANPTRVPVIVEITGPDGSTETFDGILRITLPPPPPPGFENVQPFGTVLIKVNGQFVPLTTFQQVKIGTELDTTDGRVRLTSSDGSTGFFFEGRFKIVQVFVTVNGKRKLVTILVMTAPFNECGTRTTASFSQKPKQKRKVIRKLWGNTKGSFRTQGKYASATVRGTLWETVDYCDGTLVIVREGIVDVLDLVRNEHHFVPAGDSFFTPAG